MIRGELWAWLALVVAVNSAAWAFSTPVHAPPSLLAAPAPAAQCESKTAVDNFSSECRKGCEYTITPNIKKENTVDIKARVIDATGIQPGTVKYKDDRGDTMIRVCDESIEKSLGPDLPKLKSRWIKSEEGYGADYGSSAYVDTYGSLADTGDAVYLPNSSALGEAYTLADKAEANTPAAGITQDAEQQIQDAARAAIDTDPRIESAAYQLQACASTGKCYEPQYIGADDGPSVAEYWKNNVARSAVREDTSGAIASAYPDSAGYITTQRPGTTNVWSVTEYEKWYDNDTGEVFMSRDNGQSDPVIYGKDGIPMQTSPQYGLWAVNLPSLDTPEKFGEFEKTYFDGGTTPGAFIKTDGNMVMASEAYSPYIVKEVSRDAYDAIRQQGDVANGVPGIINRTSAITSGRVLFDAPNTFPRETDAGSASAPMWALTPLPSADRATALSLVEGEAGKYPASYWQQANPVTVYTYGVRPDLLDEVRATGYSSNPRNQIWLDGDYAKYGMAKEFASTVNHELAHYNDDKLFPSDSQFGTSVYGSSYGEAYAGSSGQQAILSGKLGRINLPQGFVRDYGYAGGVVEDKATIVEAMFTNYPALQQAMQKDPILTTKVRILQDGFAQATGGDMDQAYWQRLTPIDPYWKPSPTIAPLGPRLIATMFPQDLFSPTPASLWGF